MQVIKKLFGERTDVLRLLLAINCISVYAVHFILVRTVTGIRPLSIAAGAVGMMGILLLVSDLHARLNHWLNQHPKPPYYVINNKNGRCLELDKDGSYESCLSLLEALKTEFDAQYSPHFDVGSRPHHVKEKGYWDVTIFGQEFFLMRDRGYGICICGPNPPEDPSGFLRLAAFFNAKEFLTWQQKFVRIFVRDKTHLNT